MATAVLYKDSKIRIEDHPTEVGGYSLFIGKRFYMLPDGVLPDLAQSVELGGISIEQKLDALYPFKQKLDAFNPFILHEMRQQDVSLAYLHTAIRKAYAKYQEDFKQWKKKNM